MYVITFHNPDNNQDQVILGPIDWNPEYISACIADDLDLDYRPKILKSDVDKVPYEIIPNVIARRVQIEGIEYNSKTQFLIGPYWTYTENLAIGNYVVANKNIDIVKSELKQLVQSKRYEKEISGFEFDLNDDNKIFISTGRDNRKIFFEKLSIIGDNIINFKYNDKFFDMDKQMLQQICVSIDNHVQNAFDWESNMFITIDNCESLEQLDQLSF